MAGAYLDFIENGFKWPPAPAGGYQPSKGDCCEMLCPCIPFFKPDPVEAASVEACKGEVETATA